MAERGRKTLPTPIRAVIEGSAPGERASQLVKPEWLSGKAGEIWDEVFASLWWLEEQDSPKLAVWCELYAEIQDGVKHMTAARITKWSVIGHELGFDPAGRARLGIEKDSKPESGYFD